PIQCLERLSVRSTDLHINLNEKVDREEFTSPLVGGKVLVYRGTLQPGSKRIAIKSIRYVPRGGKIVIQRIIRDVHVWSQLNHENVVRLYGIVTKFDFAVSLICEWMEKGNAYDYVQDIGVDPRSLLKGIARGLAYLHEHKPNPVIHGDLRGQHVLVSHDGRAVLTDFGLSSLVESSFVTMLSLSASWAMRWAAPELLTDPKGPSVASDIWSFGMTALELFTRQPPFHDIMNSYGLMARVMRAQPPERPRPESTCNRLTDEWWRMCCRCWSPRPSSRPRMSRIVEAIEGLVHTVLPSGLCKLTELHRNADLSTCLLLFWEQITP
ncbi:hypothetical protein ID866_11210, partial [Astraeus odoratus]